MFSKAVLDSDNFWHTLANLYQLCSIWFWLPFIVWLLRVSLKWISTLWNTLPIMTVQIQCCNLHCKSIMMSLKERYSLWALDWLLLCFVLYCKHWHHFVYFALKFHKKYAASVFSQWTLVANLDVLSAESAKPVLYLNILVSGILQVKAVRKAEVVVLIHQKISLLK